MVEEQLRMVCMDHTTAPVSLREQFAFSAEEREDACRALAGRSGEGGMIILSTCNRTELWLDGEFGLSPLEMLCSLKRLDAGEYRAHFRELEGGAAIRHLFRTASGLESQIRGENQILAQIKEALEEARNSGTPGVLLDRLFQAALGCGKKVRTGTDLGRADPGTARTAAARVRDYLASGPARESPSVLVIGNGVIGSECARLLRDAGLRVAVTIREGKQNRRAAPAGCDPVPYGDRYAEVMRRDVVISATASPHFTISREELELIWDGRERLFLDLALPRDIEEGVAALPGLSLRNIDDLEDAESAALTESENRRIDLLVEQSVAAFEEWLDARQAAKQERFLFPLFLDISGRKALVLGGGHIALRRVKKLIPFCRNIEVMAPEVCDELAGLAGESSGAVKIVRDRYFDGCCAGADFVLAATNSREVNHAIAAECGRSRIPVSVCDRAAESDFFFPALVMEESLVVGVVSSSGNHKQVKTAAEKIADALRA